MISNPYLSAQQQHRAAENAAKHLEELTAEYRSHGERLRSALAAVEGDSLDSIDTAYPAFRDVCEAVQAAGVFDRFLSDSEERYARMGYANRPPTDRQRALWAVREMISAGVEADLSRFEKAYKDLTTDAEAMRQFRGEVQDVRRELLRQVYSPLLEPFNRRAVEILESAGVVKAVRSDNDGNKWLDGEVLQVLHSNLSEEAHAALGEWMAWQDTQVPVEVVAVNVTPPPKSTRLQDEPERKRAAASDPPNEFEFIPSGVGYNIRGFGQHGHLSGLVGLRNVARLLQTPGVPVSMVELGGNSDAARCDRRSVQSAFDKAAWDELMETRNRLAEEVATASDDVEKKDSQKILDELNQSISASTGRKGQPRDLNNLANKLRPKIHDRLRTVYLAMDEANPRMNAIAEHLRDSIRSVNSVSFVYQPRAKAPDWKFEKNAEK